MRLFARRTPEQTFWDWFTKNLDRIAAIRDGSEAVVAELAQRLSAVKDGLMWEKGTLSDGRQHFIVSADGVVDHWAAVRSLVLAAPPIPGWEITAFRPRHAMDEIRYEDFHLRIADLAFLPLDSAARGPLNLTLLIPGLAEGSPRSRIAATFVLLDALIGEETAMLKLGDIQFVPREEGDGSERPLRELVGLLDAR